MATQEVQVRAAARATDADVKALVEAKLKAAYDEAMATPRPQVAEPFLWWNLYSLGPFQALRLTARCLHTK